VAAQLVLAGVMAGGTLLSAFGQIKAAKAQARAARENALWLQEQSQFIKQSTERELSIFEREARIRIGDIQGTFAKGGVDLSGSALDTVNESFGLAIAELEAIRLNGQMQMREALLKSRAQLEEASGLKKAAGLSAFGTLLSGGAQSFATARSK